MKRLFAILLVIVMLVGLCACGKDETGKSGADILADRMTEMRNKAAETAASILAGKLGIE